MAFAVTAEAGEAARREPVALVRGTCTEREDRAGEGPTAARTAQLVSRSFVRAGVPFDEIGDDEAASGGLAGRRLAILPYNPRLSPGEREALAEFVEDGGRLIVFYVADRSLWKALGIAEAKVRQRSRRAEFAEMRFVPSLREDPAGTGALAFLPAAIFQDSWNVLEVTPATGAKVLARWHDGNGRPAGGRRGLPAVLQGPGGVFFTHILHGSPTEAKARACLALAAETAGTAVLEPAARANLDAARDVPSWRGLTGLAELAGAVSEPRAGRERLLRTLREAATAEREATAALEVAAYVEALRQSMIAEAKSREAAALALPARDGEVRAVWVRNPETVDWADVAPRLGRAGFNMLLPNYVRGLRAACPSEVLETPREVSPEGSLAACIRECRRAGIEVHVWWTVLFLDDTPRERTDELERKGRLIVDDKGRAVGRPSTGWLCPSNEENLELIAEVARDIAGRFGPDGLHLDYVRLPLERSCFCGACREKFETGTAREVGTAEGPDGAAREVGTAEGPDGAARPNGAEGEDWPAALLPGGARAAEFRRFRRKRVSEVVERVARAAREARPGIYVSAAVFSELATCRETLAQDWGDWVARGLVDMLMPMNYTDSAEKLGGWVRDQARRIEGRVPLVPGIGLAAGRARIDDPAELVRQIAVARAAGADGYAIFQLDSDFLERHVDLIAAGPGRAGAGVRPHGGPSLVWRLPRGVDPESIPAGLTMEVGLRTGLRSRSGLAVKGFTLGRSAVEGGDAGARVQLESASGGPLAELGPAPGPGEKVRLAVVVPPGPFRIAVRGLAEVEGRGARPVVLRSPLYVGVTEAEREAELARSRPTGPGPRVAVLAGGYGSRGILAALRREGKFAAYPTRSLAGLGRGAGGRPDVLVLTQRRDPEELDAAARAAVRRYVETGGRVLLTHDAVGFRYHPVLFEEIARGSRRALSSVVSPVAGTPLAQTMGPEPVEHAHFDHVLITPGAGAEVLATGGDEETGKGAVVVLGRLGEGRLLACGIAIGIDADQLERAPGGREAELLSALVGHLAAGDPGESE